MSTPPRRGIRLDFANPFGAAMRFVEAIREGVSHHALEAFMR